MVLVPQFRPGQIAESFVQGQQDVQRQAANQLALRQQEQLGPIQLRTAELGLAGAERQETQATTKQAQQELLRGLTFARSIQDPAQRRQAILNLQPQAQSVFAGVLQGQPAFDPNDPDDVLFSDADQVLQNLQGPQAGIVPAQRVKDLGFRPGTTVQETPGGELKVLQQPLAPRAEQPRFTNIQTDAEGNVFGLNTQTQQIEQIPVTPTAGPARIRTKEVLAREREEKKVERKKEQNRVKAQTRLNSGLADLVSTREIIGRLRTHPGIERAVGLLSALPTIPGGQSANFEAAIETLKARLGFAELAKMRANSPTGGALGQISERELSFLQAANQSLALTQTKDQFVANLDRIDVSLQQLSDAQRSSFDQEFGDRPVTQQAQGQLPAGLPQGTVDNGDGTFTLLDGTIVEPE